MHTNSEYEKLINSLKQVRSTRLRSILLCMERLCAPNWLDANKNDVNCHYFVQKNVITRHGVQHQIGLMHITSFL